MKALAKFIMSGLSQAAMVAAVSLILSIILTPLSWISGATIALVTLHLGPQRGLQTMAIAGLTAMAFFWFALGSPLPIFGFMLLLWLPIWLSALILRQSVSLALALQSITGLGVVVVLVLQLGFTDLLQQLGTELSNSIEQVMLQNQTDVTAIQPSIDLVKRYLAGILASGLMLTIMLSLLLGRWWQSALYNPGGLNEEFNQLRLGKALAIISTLSMLMAGFIESDTVAMLAFVLGMIYMIQGTALMHSVIEIRKINRRWLYALYVTMFFIPHVAVLLVVFGLLDAWYDFRKRLTIN